jgi:hypothetical protein
MQKFYVAVVGGGASGIVAALSAGRKVRSVAICEKMPCLGKKLLASGNGRCNLSNERLDESSYNPGSRDLVRAVFSKFGKDDIRNFFKDLGLELYSEGDGRIFPITNQSSSVLKVLEIGLRRCSVSPEPNFDVVDVAGCRDGFVLASRAGKRIGCRRLIIAGGGKSYPALGSDGSSYKFGVRFGHSMVEPVPSAVPLVVKDRLCHILQGQRIAVTAKSVIDGKTARESQGELLFTRYGLSGTAILDVSEEISIALNRLHRKDVSISIDMIPFMTGDALRRELEKRASRGVPAEELLIGILPNRFSMALRGRLEGKDFHAMANLMKDMRFKVHETRGWNEAEFTSGGINAREVREETLESKLERGLYFAGEVLDVQGARGGYNLAWAWASGFVAGLAACESISG